jgi:hypothetical protein
VPVEDTELLDSNTEVDEITTPVEQSEAQENLVVETKLDEEIPVQNPTEEVN